MIELEKSHFKNHDLRVAKYDIRDSITNARNTILASFPQSGARDALLLELKRIIDISDNL